MRDSKVRIIIPSYKREEWLLDVFIDNIYKKLLAPLGKVLGDSVDLVIYLQNTPQEYRIQIDKKIKFELPDFDARKYAFEREIDTLNNKAIYRVIRGARPEILAEMSEGFNYADIGNAVRMTVVDRARRYAKETGIKMAYVSQNMLEGKIKEFEKGKSKKKRSIGFQ